MSKKFASHADTEEKNISFTKLAEGLYAYTAEGDPNSGVIIGDDSVMVIDTQATPIMAQVRTVLGDIPAEELGICYGHEHLLAAPPPEHRTPDLTLDDREAALRELEAFSRAGGSAIVEIGAVQFEPPSVIGVPAAHGPMKGFRLWFM